METHFTELKEKLFKSLSKIYETRECQNIIQLYFEDRFQLNENFNKTVTLQAKKIFDQDLKRFILQEPVQYVTGKAWFFKSLFSINNSVLIPRPETEELVRRVLKLKTNYKNPRIFDIGTGSGCIAISIAKEWTQAKIEAIDFSADAIKICKKNESDLKTMNTSFHLMDFLYEKNWTKLGSFDIIVSNPPYIPLNEAKKMSASTLKYEPLSALFPEGEDHLVFYRKILKFAEIHLHHEGVILCEINEFHTSEIIDLISEKKLSGTIHKDMQNKDRILEIRF